MIVAVSNLPVDLNALPPWFSIVRDDDGHTWFRHMLTGQWFKKS